MLCGSEFSLGCSESIFRILCPLSVYRAEAGPGHDPIGECGARESEGSTQPETGPAGEEPGEFATGEP